MATASAWWMVDLLTRGTTPYRRTIRFQTTLRPSEKQKHLTPRQLSICLTLYLSCYLADFSPTKHPTHPTRPSLLGVRLQAQL